MGRDKALSWAGDLNNEIAECRRLLKECDQCDVKAVKKRDEDLHLGEKIWDILAPSGSKDEFNGYSSIKKERKELENIKPKVEAIEAKLKEKEISPEYCRLIVKLQDKKQDDADALLGYARSKNIGNKRAAYFASYVCSNLTFSEKLVLIGTAALSEGSDRVILRRAEVRKDFVSEQRHERINQSIIDSREKYYIQAKEIFNLVPKGQYKKQAQSELRELESWHKEWMTNNVVATPTQVRTTVNSTNWKKIKKWIIIVAISDILVIACAKIYQNIGLNRIGDTYVQTVYEDGTKTKASYIVEDGVLVRILDYDSTKIAIPEEVNGQKITAIRGVELLSDEYVVEEISIPEGVTWIDNSFRGMPGLKKVILPSTLTEIRDWTFVDSNSIEEIVFHNGAELEYVAEDVLTNTVWYSKQIMEHGYVMVGNLLLAKDPFAEEAYIPEGTTVINPKAFYRDNTIKSITIPAGVRKIGAYAFAESSIESVVFEGDVDIIGEGAFLESSLNTLTFMGKAKRIDNKAFSDCQSLGMLVLPQGLEIIGDYAFSGCNGIDNIVLPEGLIKIGKEAFGVYFTERYQDKLVIPASVEEIGDIAFYGRKFEDVVIEGSIKYIGAAGLGEITNIREENGMQIVGNVLMKYTGDAKNVTIPEYISCIMAQAFRMNESIVTVSIPEGIEVIPYEMFSCCSSLSQVKLPESLKSIQYDAFEYCTSLSYIDIPEGVEEIGYHAFLDCERLNLIEGGEGLTYVANTAFDGVSLTSEFRKKLEKIWESQEE